jgi:hypothetical protein
MAGFAVAALIVVAAAPAPARAAYAPGGVLPEAPSQGAATLVPYDQGLPGSAPDDPGALHYIVSPSTYAALQRGELPPAWQVAFDDAGLQPPSPQELAAIPALARDHAQVLIRLPESMRAIADSPGGRCRPLKTLAEAATMSARATAKLHAWRTTGIDPAGPSPILGERTQPPEFWQSLVQAVNADRFAADLDYLSTTLQTRYAYTPQMDLACEYAYDEFAALGLQTSFDAFTWNGHALKNVLAIQPGTVDPSRIYVIVGHLDSISPNPWSLAPGAEDNGSGSAAVLETARLFAGIPTDYTIYYLCVTAEEQGLIGSEHFAALADQQNLDIRGVLNFDMVAWYDPAGADLWIEGFHQGVSSVWLMNLLQQNAQTYAGLTTYLYPGEGWGSDHEPFHDHGFPAILSIENEWVEYPCYHQTCDTVDHLTPALWQGITAANAVTLGQLAQAQGAIGAIEGTVTVAGGGDPQGATLRLSGAAYPPATSGPAGEFALPAIFPGRYTLVAELPGYAPVATDVVVPSGGVVEADVSFDGPLPASVQGVVRGPNGLPLSGARIEIEGQSTWALSGFDGTFTLDPVTPGAVNLSASFSGMLPRGTSAQLSAGQNLSGIDLRLAQTWDFEASAEGLAPSGGWEWGSDGVAGAHSGTNVWGTVLGGDYADCADYRLDFPAISLRPYSFARLQLWSWYATQTGADGGNLQASTDGGQSWAVITPTPEYDGLLAGACNPIAGEPAQSGDSGGWIARTYPLDDYLGGWVRLRLHFGSDDSGVARGWYVDDLSFQGNFGSSSVEEHSSDGAGPGEPDGRGIAQTGVRAAPGVALRVGPNPSSRVADVSVWLESGAGGRLSIFDAGGREVAVLHAGGRLEAGWHSFSWSGLETSGRTAGAGAYWARFDGGGARATKQLIRIR